MGKMIKNIGNVDATTLDGEDVDVGPKVRMAGNLIMPDKFVKRVIDVPVVEKKAEEKKEAEEIEFEKVAIKEVEIVKSNNKDFEKNFFWFWHCFNRTFGQLLANHIEKKSIALIQEKLPFKRVMDLNDVTKRTKIIAKFRRNFGAQKFNKLFELRTSFFNRNSLLLQHFCEHVANADALDDVYNAIGSFNWNGETIWPKAAKLDCYSKFYLSCPDAQSVRNRYRQVLQLYKQIGGGKTLSIACGSAQSVIHAIYKLISRGEDNNIHLCLTDVSKASLDLAKSRAVQAGIEDKVSFLQSSYQELPEILAGEKFDIVEACGILDYLPDRYAIKLIQFSLSVLRKEGQIIISNMAETRSADLLRKMYNWELIYRSPQKFGELIKKAGGRNIKIYLEPWGIHSVATATNYFAPS